MRTSMESKRRKQHKYHHEHRSEKGDELHHMDDTRQQSVHSVASRSSARQQPIRPRHQRSDLAQLADRADPSREHTISKSESALQAQKISAVAKKSKVPGSGLARKRTLLQRATLVTKTTGVPYSILSMIQHTVLLFKHEPGFVGSFGKLDVAQLSVHISNYRNFFDLSIPLRFAESIKEHKVARDGPGQSEVMRCIVWIQLVAGILYATLDSGAFLTSRGIIKTSSSEAQSKAISSFLSRSGCKFWMVRLLLNYVKLGIESQADHTKDRHYRRDHPKRETDAAISRAESRASRSAQDAAFFDAQTTRRAARHRQSLVNSIWLPVAISYCIKDGPISSRWASRFTILGHATKLQGLWKTMARP